MIRMTGMMQTMETMEMDNGDNGGVTEMMADDGSKRGDRDNGKD